VAWQPTDASARPWHFYDLDADPLELHNLVDDPQCREELARHHQLLRTMLEEAGDFYPLAEARP
jgi:arylsulfatase A-like enzyme